MARNIFSERSTITRSRPEPRYEEPDYHPSYNNRNDDRGYSQCQEQQYHQYQPEAPVMLQPMGAQDLHRNDVEGAFFALIALLNVDKEELENTLYNQWASPKDIVNLIITNPDVNLKVVMAFMAWVFPEDIKATHDKLYNSSPKQFDEWVTEYGLTREDFRTLDLDKVIESFDVTRRRQTKFRGGMSHYNRR